MTAPVVSACLYAALGIGDAVILGALGVCVGLAVAFMVRRRRGGGGCCGCSGCASREFCGKCRSTERKETDTRND